MTQENKPSGYVRDPPPLSSGVQKVFLYGDDGSEGWKAVIDCPKGKGGKCNSDYQLSDAAVGINEQRRQALFHRMGIR
jgi:hypothetical protein